MSKVIQRVEIVCGRILLDKLTAKLKEVGVTSYTVIPEVLGNGDRGMRSGDGVVGASRNVVMILYCDKDRVAKIKEIVTPILSKYGGIAMATDVDVLFTSTC